MGRALGGPGYMEAAGNLRLYVTQLRRKLQPDPVPASTDGERPARLVDHEGSDQPEH